MKPSRVCCLDLLVGAGEVRGKSPPHRSLYRGSVGARCRRLYSQLLVARQIALSQAFLLPEQALLCL